MWSGLGRSNIVTISMDAEQNLIFRYDNAPHHPEARSFPHHKHTFGDVIESQEPGLMEVLFEISRKAHT